MFIVFNILTSFFEFLFSLFWKLIFSLKFILFFSSKEGIIYFDTKFDTLLVVTKESVELFVNKKFDL